MEVYVELMAGAALSICFCTSPCRGAHDFLRVAKIIR